MQINVIKQCKVCEAKENVYFHYGVCTCRACGAFFRRYLANENKCKYNCKCLPEQLSEGNKDERLKTNLAKCRKYRLEKCLSVGMKRLDVGYVRRDICRKEMEKQWNEINVNLIIL
ncbi:unnamed protein product [Meloidogyne enterolobii]|uniref:Uncharacterized protein n=1 Tax=Meloidogyne enterolobii TaxID=390850 RepID=A0ACB1A912_MELEN